MSSAATPQQRLRSILGLSFGLAVVVGGTLGIGILRTPGLVASQLGSPSFVLLAWLIGGLYTLLAAACMTELGGRMTRAGGYYGYARLAFGDAVGFAVGWMDWIANCAALGYIAIGTSELLGVLIPPLATWTRPIAMLLLLGFVLLHWAGLRVSSSFQEWTTAFKFIAFLLLIAGGLALSEIPSSGSPLPAISASPLSFIVALQVIIPTYGGWQSALYFTEEDRDPRRNLPRAMLGGALVVISIYALINVTLLMVLTMQELASSTFPAATAAQKLGGDLGGQLITIVSLLSLPPLLNAVLMIGTRILFGMSRDKLMWHRSAAISSRGTPGVAAILTASLALVLIATGTFQRLGGVAASYLAINCSICSLALIALRRREGAPTNSARAWGYPWSPIIVILGASAFLIGMMIEEPGTAILAMAMLGAGLLGYYLARRWLK